MIRRRLIEIYRNKISTVLNSRLWCWYIDLWVTFSARAAEFQLYMSSRVNLSASKFNQTDSKEKRYKWLKVEQSRLRTLFKTSMKCGADSACCLSFSRSQTAHIHHTLASNNDKREFLKDILSRTRKNCSEGKWKIQNMQISTTMSINLWNVVEKNVKYRLGCEPIIISIEKVSSRNRWQLTWSQNSINFSTNPIWKKIRLTICVTINSNIIVVSIIETSWKDRYIVSACSYWHTAWSINWIAFDIRKKEIPDSMVAAAITNAIFPTSNMLCTSSPIQLPSLMCLALWSCSAVENKFIDDHFLRQLSLCIVDYCTYTRVEASNNNWMNVSIRLRRWDRSVIFSRLEKVNFSLSLSLFSRWTNKQNFSQKVCVLNFQARMITRTWNENFIFFSQFLFFSWCISQQLSVWFFSR